jgi:hypothetical protein
LSIHGYADARTPQRGPASPALSVDAAPSVIVNMKDGWNLYNPKKEYERLGFLDPWRFRTAAKRGPWKLQSNMEEGHGGGPGGSFNRSFSTAASPPTFSPHPEGHHVTSSPMVPEAPMSPKDTGATWRVASYPKYFVIPRDCTDRMLEAVSTFHPIEE